MLPEGHIGEYCDLGSGKGLDWTQSPVSIKEQKLINQTSKNFKSAHQIIP